MTSVRCDFTLQVTRERLNLFLCENDAKAQKQPEAEEAPCR
jgi:hypothetical protein